MQSSSSNTRLQADASHSWLSQAAAVARPMSEKGTSDFRQQARLSAVGLSAAEADAEQAAAQVRLSLASSCRMLSPVFVPHHATAASAITNPDVAKGDCPGASAASTHLYHVPVQQCQHCALLQCAVISESSSCQPMAKLTHLSCPAAGGLQHQLSCNTHLPCPHRPSQTPWHIPDPAVALGAATVEGPHLCGVSQGVWAAGVAVGRQCHGAALLPVGLPGHCGRRC